MNKSTKSRILSLDILKGLVMILMTLDHVRDYFHYDSFFFDPEDLTQTTPVLFLTRFVTHFCAPVFVLLAGTSANLVGRKMDKKELSIWLLKRGFWLMLLEVTLVKFGWTFNPSYHTVGLLVIWALGAGMVSLAIFIHLPRYVSLAVAALMIFGHNALDGFAPQGNGFLSLLWKLLHVRGPVVFDGFTLRITYPVIPWLGVMIAGYYFGDLFRPGFEQKRRLKFLFYSGISCLILFVLLRWNNSYGEPVPWSRQASPVYSFLSFINVSKYPPSLLYLLITIGPSLLFLYLFEKMDFSWLSPVMTIGRVPMFWYLVHLYVIHLGATLAAVLTGFQASDMVLTGFISLEPQLKGYGFSLGVVYLVWIVICLIMYALSVWYDKYKRENRDKWWLSYL